MQPRQTQMQRAIKDKHQHARHNEGDWLLVVEEPVGRLPMHVRQEKHLARVEESYWPLLDPVPVKQLIVRELRVGKCYEEGHGVVHVGQDLSQG